MFLQITCLANHLSVLVNSCNASLSVISVIDQFIQTGTKIFGFVRELNPGPLAPEARIIPLDQQATMFALLSTLSSTVCLFH